MRFCNWASLTCLLLGTHTYIFGQIHPADTDANQRISLVELTAYGKAWAEENSWPAEPSPISEAYYQRAEYLWKNGERYTQRGEAPLPQGWVPDPEDGTNFLAADNLEPEPLDIVEVFGLPDDQSNLFAEYTSVSNPQPNLTYVVALGDSRFGVVIPFMAKAPGGAEPFDLTIRSDEGDYPVGLFNPVPLPPAAGTGQAAAEALKDIGDQIGNLMGENLASYFQTPLAEIPLELRIPVMVDQVVRDPANPNNLSKLLDGTAPILDEYDVDPATTNSILAKLGILEQVDAMQTLLNTVPASTFPPLVRNQAATSTIPLAVKQSDSAILSYSTLGELAQGMQKQCEQERKATPGPNEQALRDQLSVVASGVAIAGGPIGAAAAASFNTTLWALDSYSQMVANQWPSDITDFTIELSHPSFLEDKCETGKWSATITASSKGWSLDKTLVSGALNVVGAAGALGAGAKASEAARANLSNAEELVVDISSEAGVFAFGKAFPGEGGFIEVPPSTWGGITVTDSDLSLLDITYEGASVKAVGEPSFDYEPNEETGNTILKLLTKPGVLGPCAAPQGSAIQIEVKPNRVTLSPLGGEIEPDEERTFTAEVMDAENKEIEFFVSHGDILEQKQVAGSDQYELKYKAPSEAEMPDQIEITAVSTTEECLRANVTRERTTFLRPKGDNLVLDPNVTCMERGSIVDFQVIDTEGGEVPPITWELIGVGTLSPSGTMATYNATSNGEPVIVRATTQEDEPQVLEQEFIVGSCLAVGLTFNMPQSVTTAASNTGFLSLTDVPLANEGDPQATKQFEFGASVEVSSIAGGEVSGVLNGHAVRLSFPIDDDPTRGQEVYRVGDQHELTVGARVDFNKADPENVPVTWVAPGKIEIDFAAVYFMSGTWPDPVEFTNWTWQFSDGTELVGPTVSKVMDVGAPWDKWVLITVANSVGHTASYLQDLRFLSFTANFSGPYNPSGPTFCLSDCTGEINLTGPRPGSLKAALWTANPNPQEEGKHLISINY